MGKLYKRNKNLFILLLFVFNIGLLSFFIIPELKSLNQPCANSISCINDLRGQYDASGQYGEFGGKVVYAPAENIFAHLDTPVLGSNTGQKRIAVDLTTQHLYAYEGNSLIMDFPVSTGKWGKTPIGTFRIWVKLRNTLMAGGSRALRTSYYLPNVPYTMYFYNAEIPQSRGFGIHGAYWHNNFGHPMSHGCVNEPLDMAEKLFNWAEPASTGFTTHATPQNQGTQVDIYGTAPNS